MWKTKAQQCLMLNLTWLSISSEFSMGFLKMCYLHLPHLKGAIRISDICFRNLFIYAFSHLKRTIRISNAWSGMCLSTLPYLKRVISFSDECSNNFYVFKRRELLEFLHDLMCYLIERSHQNQKVLNGCLSFIRIFFKWMWQGCCFKWMTKYDNYKIHKWIYMSVLWEKLIMCTHKPILNI